MSFIFKLIADDAFTWLAILSEEVGEVAQADQFRMRTKP